MRVQPPKRARARSGVTVCLAIDADINLVEIVKKHGDLEVDEFILDLPLGQPHPHRCNPRLPLPESKSNRSGTTPGVVHRPRRGTARADAPLLPRAHETLV